MFVEPESIDEVERALRPALERMPAPPGLKRKLLLRREALHAERRRRLVRWWQRLAAAATLAGVLVCAMVWRSTEQRRHAEEVRREVMVALRITNHALQQMQAQLAAHDQDAQE
jgi:hypothetical protein